MINMVPYIVEHKHAGSYEPVVATLCLDVLSEPADEDIRIHGIWEANKKARINTLDNAAEATRNGWGHGKVNCGQHEIKMDYTISQNAALCASLLGVSNSLQSKPFDPEDMRGALSKSKLFTGLSKPNVADILEWSLCIMSLVPVGFPENYLVQCYQS